jgi:TolB-like protein
MRTRCIGRRLATVLILLWPVGVTSAQEMSELARHLSVTLAEGVQDRAALRVAVTDFPDLGGSVSDLGRYLAERITTHLSQTRPFSVVERRRLTTVLAELRLGLFDLFRADGVRMLGRALGAEAVVVGTLSDLGSQVDVDVRLIETETGLVLAGAEGTLRKTEEVENLLGRGVGRGTTGPARAAP